MQAHIGLGSNLGERAANLARARLLLRRAGAVIVARSSIYRTEPVGEVEQGEFVNQVVGWRLLPELEQVGHGSELPHPRLHLRRFVLEPLAEIAPRARHPVLGRSAAAMLTACLDRSRVERIAPRRRSRICAPDHARL